MQDHETARWRSYAPVAALLLCSALYYLRLLAAPGNSYLTGDELWAGSVTNLSLFDTLVFVLRFDIHPPVYYLLVNLWSHLGHGEAVLLASSIVTQLALILATFLAGRRIHGAVAGFAAACLVATLPMLVFYGIELRMYALVALLAMIGFWQVDDLCRVDARAGRRPLLAYGLVSLLIVYAHATGFFVVLSHYVYGAATLRAGGVRRRQRRWFILHGVIGVLAVPAVLNSLVRKAGHATAPDALRVLKAISHLVNADRIDVGPPCWWAVIPAIILVILAMATLPAARRAIAAYLILPLALCLLVSHLIRPIWLDRMFIYALPIVTLAICAAVVRLLRDAGRGAQAAAAAGLAGVMGLFVLISSGQADVRMEPDYPKLDGVMLKVARPGDCVFVTGFPAYYWGVVRTMIGPDWGSPLAIQPAPDNRWKLILARMSPRLMDFTDLRPRGDEVQARGLRLIAGHPDPVGKRCAGATYFVNSKEDEPELLGAGVTGPLLMRSGNLSFRRLR